MKDVPENELNENERERKWIEWNIFPPPFTYLLSFCSFAYINNKQIKASY